MWNLFKKSTPAEKINAEDVKQILHAYGDLLCDQQASLIQDESHLPTTKDRIKQALVVAIATAQNDEERSGYKSAYVFLASFQHGLGAKPLQLPPEGLDIKEIDRHADDIERLAYWAEKMEAESKILQQELRAIEEKLGPAARSSFK
jgi:hypothetical protein